MDEEVLDMLAEQDEETRYRCYGLVSSNSRNCRKIDTFLERFMVNPGDTSTSEITDLHTAGGSYLVPPAQIPVFFDHLENCRVENMPMSRSEKQLEYSGIMLDFDIVQNQKTTQLTTEIIRNLVRTVFMVIREFVALAPDLKIAHAVVTAKPTCKLMKDDSGAYKDGVHILFPGIKIQRPLKHMIIDYLISSGTIADVLEAVVPARHLTDRSPSQFLDNNSGHVPVFFLGCITKRGSTPYVLRIAYQFRFAAGSTDVDMMSVTDDFRNSPNLCNELSVNWEFEHEQGIIKKANCEVHVNKSHAYAKMLTDKKRYKASARAISQDIDVLAMRNPEVQFHRDLLDILSKERCEDYKLWSHVIFALANTSSSYFPLALHFSRKSPKFNRVELDKFWRRAVAEGRVSGYRITSIQQWAKKDNPVKYKKYEQTTIHSMARAMLHDFVVLGDLKDGHIARILFALLKHKYVCSILGGKEVWFEFMMPEDDHGKLELYKWALISSNGIAPASLFMYIDTSLADFFKVLVKGVQDMHTTANGNVARHYQTVFKNFRRVTNELANISFVTKIVRACTKKFTQRGFVESLDQNPMVRGVRNGVLQLCPDGRNGPLMIESCHAHRVSKSTEASYRKFNIEDDEIKRIIIALRNMFPDNEDDSFMFVMYWLASTLDSRSKDSMFVIMIGGGSNGKSVLMSFHNSVLGSTYCSPLPITFITGKSGHAEAASPATMMLKYASLCIYSESERGDMLNMSKIKQFTGKEPMTGRNLHESCETFTPNAHHLMMSNSAPLINSSDWGTWRRLIMIRMKIKFSPNPDPNNPLERLSDPTVADKWPNSEPIKAKYYGFMAYMHFLLNRLYGGDLRKVSYPHIQSETDEYRRQQDPITKFLTRYLISYTPEHAARDETVPIRMNLEHELAKYCEWYNTQYGVNPAMHGLVEQFQNSVLRKMVTRVGHNFILIGHKFLGMNEQLDEAIYQHSNIEKAVDEDEEKAKADNYGIPVHTAEQWWDDVFVPLYMEHREAFESSFDDGFDEEDDDAAHIESGDDELPSYSVIGGDFDGDAPEIKYDLNSTLYKVEAKRAPREQKGQEQEQGQGEQGDGDLSDEYDTGDLYASSGTDGGFAREVDDRLGLPANVPVSSVGRQEVKKVKQVPRAKVQAVMDLDFDFDDM